MITRLWTRLVFLRCQGGLQVSWARWLGWCLCLLMLGACQNPLADWSLPWQANSAAILPTVTPTAPTQQAPIQFWSWSAGELADQRLLSEIERFQEANPALLVEPSLVSNYDASLSAALASNTPPDLFLLDITRVSELAGAGQVAALAAVDTLGDDYFPALLPALVVDGQLVCAPRESRTLALIYNRTAFDAANLAYPSAAWTWDELRSAAEALTAADPTMIGLALSPDFTRWLPFLYQAGGSVTDPAMSVMTINSAEAASALDYYVRLVIDEIAAPPARLESSWAGEALGRGRAAMAIEGNWMIPYLQQNYPDLEWGVAELPAGPQGRATVVFATCYAIAANSTQPLAARRLLDHLTSTAVINEEIAASGSLPPRLSLAAEWRAQYPEFVPFLDGMAYARPWLLGNRFAALFRTVNNGMEQSFLSVRGVTDILAEADGVGNRALAQ